MGWQRRRCGSVIAPGAYSFLSLCVQPDREDEKRRIESVGGRVIFWNGYRVLGVLAMSRAIGESLGHKTVEPTQAEYVSFHCFIIEQ